MTITGVARSAVTRTPTERLERAGEVFDLVRRGRAGTVAELSAVTGLARSTVSARIDRLAALDLLRADGAARESGLRGRPPARLRFNPDAGALLVAHVGLSAARVAVTDLAGTVLCDTLLQRPLDDDPAGYLKELGHTFTELLDQAPAPVERVRGVGLGLPSTIELAVGRSDHDLPTHHWVGFDVAGHLHEQFAVPVVIDTDVTQLALGEQRLCWPDEDVVVCVKAGTVIGAGVVAGGVAVRGAQAMAGGIGHTRLAGRTEPCLCGNVGCLDAVAGGTALAAMVREHGHPAADVRDVARLAREGVLPAVQAVRQAGRCIGEVLAGVVNLLNPGVVALWGYLVEAEEPLLAGIKETLYQGALPGATRSLRLVPAGLGVSAGLRGAALMAADTVLAPEAVDELVATG